MYGFESTSLDGIWDFAFLGNIDIASISPCDINYDDIMAVPCCFDATPKYAGKRGLCAYGRDVIISQEKPVRFHFDGVHHYCRVYLNDKYLGDHIGGFTQFSFDSPAGVGGKCRLTVLVDNRIDYDQCPLHLEYFDWYHFGGIARAVSMRQLDDVNIDSVRFTTTDYAKRAAKVEVSYSTIAETTGEVDIEVSFDGKVVAVSSANASSACGTEIIKFTVDGAALWSPDSPALHQLEVKLGSQTYSAAVGLREVALDGRDMLINGQKIRPMGFCRHEAHPQTGHTISEALMVSDLQQLRDMGCNYIRGSHYPQDQKFLQLCDRLGIMVWSESIGWQHKVEHLTDEKFISAQRTNITEMVLASQNNPSVIMWGVLNESHSHEPAARAGYENLLGLLRELDDSRPVTYACNHPFDDVCMDLADIVAINMYPGWYLSQLEDIVPKLDQMYEQFYNQPAHRDKPLIISEIGAGAIYGWRDRHATRWSEQYQCELLDRVLKHIIENPQKFSGLAIWQFCDLRTSEFTSTALGRPRDFNNKGVVDEYRREKAAYQLVRKHFTEMG